MTRPAVAVGLVRLHILGPDLSDRGYLSAIGASGGHSKAIGNSALSFTGNTLEDDLDADPALLEDAFAVTELDVGGTWTPFGTPFVLAPGSGRVIPGPPELSPVAAPALDALAGECIVLPNSPDEDSPTMRYACGIEGNRYVGWQSIGYSESLHSGSWHDGDVYDPAGQPKEGKPENWDPVAATADWVFRDADEGGLTLLRIGTFTLADRTTIKFISSADEEHKIYLDGPNMGGVIIDAQGDETGYTEKNHWRKRLEPGTYRVSAEFTTVSSVGGDGNDSIRFACGPMDTEGDIAEVLLATSSDTRVSRQGKNDERPGLSPMETVRRLLADNSDLGVAAADILLDDKSFTDSSDSASESPSGDDCREWVWPLGTSIASVLSDMSEDADFDLSPAFEFSCWLDRGADLSATVELTPGADPPTAGMNIVEHGYESDPRGPNGYLTQSQDGWDLVMPTITDSARRVLGSFESGASPSVGRARRNARSAIRQAGRVRRHYTTQIIAVDGCIPYVDFTLCDIVHGRGYRNLGLDLEVTEISWTQGDGTTLFTLSLGEV